MNCGIRRYNFKLFFEGLNIRKEKTNNKQLNNFLKSLSIVSEEAFLVLF